MGLRRAQKYNAALPILHGAVNIIQSHLSGVWANHFRHIRNAASSFPR